MTLPSAQSAKCSPKWQPGSLRPPCPRFLLRAPACSRRAAPARTPNPLPYLHSALSIRQLVIGGRRAVLTAGQAVLGAGVHEMYGKIAGLRARGGEGRRMQAVARAHVCERGVNGQEAGWVKVGCLRRMWPDARVRGRRQRRRPTPGSVPGGLLRVHHCQQFGKV